MGENINHITLRNTQGSVNGSKLLAPQAGPLPVFRENKEELVKKKTITLHCSVIIINDNSSLLL